MKLILVFVLYLIILSLDEIYSIKIKYKFSKGTYSKDSSYQSFFSDSGMNQSGYKYGLKSDQSKSKNISASSENKTYNIADENIKTNVEASQVSAEAEDDVENNEEKEPESEAEAKSKVDSEGSSKLASDKEDDNDDGSDEEEALQSDVEKKVSEKVSEKADENELKTNLVQAQHNAKQRKFNLANTVYSAPDVTSTNYVFLSPSVQRTIDRKIVKLQREGKRHGSMRETKAVGEWQKRFYRRPIEYTELKSSNRGESSMLTWVILCFILVLILVLCICGAKFFFKS